MKTRTTLLCACALASLAFAGSSASAATAYQNAVLADNPLLYYTFDEASGNAIEQVTGNAGDALTPINGATRTASGTTTGGVGLGSAASFDGTNDFFRSTTMVTTSVPSSRWALEFWVRPETKDGGQYILHAFAGTNNNPAAIFDFANGGTQDELEMFTAFGRTGNTTDATDSAILTRNTWHHVVMAFYGNNSGFADNLRELYIDGVLALSDTTSTTSAGWGSTSLFVGAANAAGANAFDGLVDEIALYDLGPQTTLATDQAQVAGIVQHFNVVPTPAALPAGLTMLGLLSLRRRR